MSPLGIFLITAIIALPLAWLVSEFWEVRALRITLGILAIVVVATCLCGLNSVLTKFNYNAWYGAASKNLIDSTVSQIEDGNIDRVMKVLRRLNVDYQPTYENRAHYDEIVTEAVAEMTGENELTDTKWDTSPVSRETWAGHWEDDSGFWIVIGNYGKDLHIVRSGDDMPKMTDVSLSADSQHLSFNEASRGRHELTFLNKYEAKHVWRDFDTGHVWRTDTLHKLVRATPEQRLFTQQAPPREE